jgi:hypothetical protein
MRPKKTPPGLPTSPVVVESSAAPYVNVSDVHAAVQAVCRMTGPKSPLVYMYIHACIYGICTYLTTLN